MKNFTNNFKQFTSRLSARWLIMALMLLVGTSSAWAATITSDGTACLYFNMKAIDWWNNDGVTHFAYFFNDTSGKNAWSTKAVNYNGDYYYVKIPSGTWEKVILTRNSSNATNGSWDNKHNQTANIPLSSSSNYLSYFKEGSNDASTNDYTWGTAIKPTSTASLSASSTSVNTGVDVTLTPSLTSNTTYNEIKSTTYSISPTSGASISGNKFTATAAGTYTVTATITYNPRGYSSLTSTVKPTITITVTNPVTVTSYQLAGFNDWSNPITMTKNGNIYTCAKELTAKTYTGGTNEAGFKIIENYSNSTKKWYGNDGTMERDNCSGWTMAVDKNNCGITADVAGTYTFTFDATNKKLTVKYPPECTPSATITEATYSCYGNTIHLEGSLTEACGGMYYGWQYKTTAGDDWSTATPIVGHATNNYSESTTTYELDWTIPDPGTTYYFRAYATLDAKTWYSDGTTEPVKTYKSPTLYTVSGSDATLTLSNSESGYTYTLYNYGNLVSNSATEGTGNALSWTLNDAGTYTVKAKPAESSCDEVSMSGSYTYSSIIESATISLVDREGKELDVTEVCPQSTVYLKVSYVGGDFTDFVAEENFPGTDLELVNHDKTNNYAIFSFTATAAGTANITISNKSGSTVTPANGVSITLKDVQVVTPPIITINPESAMICQGDDATISIVEENQNYTYTIYKDGEALNPQSFTITEAGVYTVGATENECNTSATSMPIELKVVSSDVKIGLEADNTAIGPWQPLKLTVTPAKGYEYTLEGLDGMVYTKEGDVYTIKIPRPNDWSPGNSGTQLELEKEDKVFTAKIKVSDEVFCGSKEVTVTLTDTEENCE